MNAGNSSHPDGRGADHRAPGRGSSCGLALKLDAVVAGANGVRLPGPRRAPSTAPLGIEAGALRGIGACS